MIHRFLEDEHNFHIEFLLRQEDYYIQKDMFYAISVLDLYIFTLQSSAIVLRHGSMTVCYLQTEVRFQRCLGQQTAQRHSR